MDFNFELFGFETINEGVRIGGFWFCQFDDFDDTIDNSKRSLFSIYWTGYSIYLSVLFFNFEF